MCCCGKPVINGEMGYKWQPEHSPIVRQPAPPALQDGDALLYDEPGYRFLSWAVPAALVTAAGVLRWMFKR